VRALDLFCCGGGAGRGLADAGMEVVGVDIADRSKHYPYEFLQGNALTLNPAWIATFDFVWASPPCQRYSVMSAHSGSREDHPDLVEPTRALLQKAGVPFAMENVVQAPLQKAVMLCGKMFGLELIRHRIFELHGFTVLQPHHEAHDGKIITVTGNTGGSSTRDGGDRFGSIEEWKRSMGIDWLPAHLLKEAIPPIYSRYIAEWFLGPQRWTVDPNTLLATDSPQYSLFQEEEPK